MNRSRPRLVLDYDDVLTRLEGAPSLLLGNGFSIGASPQYRYTALRERADEDLPEIAKSLFEKLKTSNFEQVMQVLEDARYVHDQYALDGLTERLVDDIEATRRAMVTAIAADHLPSPRALDQDPAEASGEDAENAEDVEDASTEGETKIDYAARFLEPYDRLFTTNYDLLLYWTAFRLQGADGRYKHPDGLVRPEGEDFGAFDPEIATTMFFLHGALHLYDQPLDEPIGLPLESSPETAERTARKLVAQRNLRLKTLVDRLLAQGRLPLFIAEGTAEQKRLRIESNLYLRHCLEAFGAIDGDLVVYGHSLGPSDAHLLAAIAANPRLRRLFVGLYGDPEKAANLQIRAALAGLGARRRALDRPLEIHLYASRTAPVWGPASTR